MNCITIVSDDLLWYLYSSKGGAQAVELAASIVENPYYRVGLAATIVDLAVGLAASFGELTG